MPSEPEHSPRSVSVRRLSSRERRPRWRLRMRVGEGVARSLVLIPACYLVVAAALGVVVPAVDRARDGGFLGLDSDAARSVLESVASGMITFSGLVVSVAVLVIQFGAGQYSPRLVLIFRRDPVVKNALGMFVAPGLYALVAVGAIGGSGSTVEPNLTVLVALLLMGGALIALFRFIGRLLDLMRPRRIYARLSRLARVALRDVYPFSIDEDTERAVMPDGPAIEVVTHDRRDAVLAAVDRAEVVRAASEAGAVVEVAVPVGAYVAHGQPLFTVRGGTRIDEARLQHAVVLADGRTITQDPAFAIRAIVDVAIRALSPAINDPTTAVEALDVLETLLLRLAHRDLGGSVVVDDGGEVRLLMPTAGWKDLVDAALTEIRHYGANAPQVARRMRALLDALERGVPDSRLAEVRAQRALLDAAVERHFPDPAELELVTTPDRLGLAGPRADLV